MILIIIGSVIAYLLIGVGVAKLIDMINPEITREYAGRTRGPVEKEMVGLIAFFWPWAGFAFLFIGLAILWGRMVAKVLG